MKTIRRLILSILLSLTASSPSRADITVRTAVLGVSIVSCSCAVGAMPSSAEERNPISGFWNAEPLPWLRLQRTGDSVVIAWPASFTGFQLEQAATLGTGAAWANVTQPVSTANGENQVTITIGPASRFFRLHQP
jgi:hypothetical protein